MSAVHHIVDLVVRQAAEISAAATTSAAAAAATAPPACQSDNDYDGRIGLRVSAIFVILIGSMFGACFPVFAGRHRGVGVPEWIFFIAKYFGSGVIIATAFIHLLAPASDALTNPCLTGPITDYDWAEGIALMAVFILFFTELMAMRFATFGTPPGLDSEHGIHDKQKLDGDLDMGASPHTPGEDHLSHSRTHRDNDHDHSLADSSNHNHGSSTTTTTVATATAPRNGTGIHDVEDYAAQMTAIFILEFGVIFHSIFIGLTLAVSGAEFNTLYVVLVFHQTFEGLGLGSRLAATPWPKNRRFTPYLFGMAYGLTTPIAIAVGLGVRMTYTPGSARALIVNGCFDSISAGILLYTGLVELMAHEFMFSSYMRRAKLSVVLSAFGVMCLGAGLMALLGKWA